MKFLKRYQKNYDVLQRIAKEIGKRYEARPYDELCGGLADGSGGEIEVAGVLVAYSAYSFNVKPNGDVCFCIDIRSKLPTLMGIKPSYQFCKRRDGTVYYP